MKTIRKDDEKMEIKIKLLPGGKMPTKAHRTDAAWDCYARHDTTFMMIPSTANFAANG